MLGPLIDALTPYLPGWIELPEAHGAAWGFAKGRLHKYIKRVPKPGGGYRYYYNAAHGGTVAHSEHFVEGASFKDHEGHWHIKSKDGDTLHLRHDETGEERKMTHAQLAEHLGSLHGATIKQAREAASKALADAREAGASKKQIARLEERARRVGVDVAKEAQRAAFEAHRKTTGEFHPWDPAERTPGKAKLEAVGDHIWGSRKDLASRRINSAEDLKGMNYSDAAALVRKSKLATAPTLTQAKESGMTPGAAALAISLVASIREKPDDTSFSRERYVTQVRRIMGVLESAKTAAQINDAVREMQLEARYYQRAELATFGSDQRAEAHKAAEEMSKETGRKIGVYTKNRYGHGGGYVLRDENEGPFDQLGRNFDAIISNSGKDWRSARAMASALDSQPSDVGWKFLESKNIGTDPSPKEPRAKTAKRETVKDIRGDVRRTGGASVPDASPKRTREKFGFREIDYGREGYMSQADREFHTKALEEATHDLVDVLGIDPKQASFNGRIGIAMGARGRGNAAAHYEPGRHAINITRVSGAGSYAHEWGHALDDIVARHYMPDMGVSGVMGATNHADSRHLPKDVQDAFKGVVDAMTKAKDPEKARAEHKAKLAEATSHVAGLRKEYDRLNTELQQANTKPKTAEELDRRVAGLESRAKYAEAAAKELRAKSAGKPNRSADAEAAGYEASAKVLSEAAHRTKQGGLQTDSDRAKAEQLAPLVESARTAHNDAEEARHALSKMDPTITNFARESRLKDGKRAYWSTPHEMFARAFETHVHHKLKEQGRENSYLVNGDKLAIEGREGLYPEGEELAHISKAIDNLIGALKKGGHLAKALSGMSARRGVLAP